ncbi:MAG: hypothetical protein V4689_15450 [Verrucomicrobiota bacterium]
MKKRSRIILTLGLASLLGFIIMMIWPEIANGFPGSPSNFKRILGFEAIERHKVALSNGGIQGMVYFGMQDLAGEDGRPLSPDYSKMADHPLPATYEKEKTFLHWKNSPIHSEHLGLSNYCLKMLNAENFKGDNVETMKTTAGSVSAYYSYSAEVASDGRMNNITFLIFDPLKARLYTLTNTSYIYDPKTIP